MYFGVFEAKRQKIRRFAEKEFLEVPNHLPTKRRRKAHVDSFNVRYYTE